MGRRLQLGMAALLLVALHLPASPSLQAAAPETAIATINAWRARAGVAPLVAHPALGQAAQSHAIYYQLNYGDPDLAGIGLHQQKPGRPGFTGVEPEDRARAAGYGSSAVNENAGLTGDLADSLRWHIATVNHRLPLLDPRYTDIGVGVVNEGRVKFDVILVGTPRWTSSAAPTWVAWPVDGAAEVGLSYHGESPNPFPGQRYPVGYPVTLAYFGPGVFTVTDASLRTPNGATVASTVRQGTGWHSRRAALLVATSVLTPATGYTVEVRGAIDGASFSRRWSFTTAGSAPLITPPPPTAAPNQPAPPPPAPEPTPRGGRLPTMPSGLTAAPEAIRDLWMRSDGRRIGSTDPAWLWGPDAIAIIREPYAEAPGGERAVVYFDKSRMEINDPMADPRAAWFVTTGLLVKEMVTGTIQVGHTQFVDYPPADIPLVGDGAGPTPSYAAVGPLVSSSSGVGRVAPRLGQPVTTTLDASGTPGTDERLASLARIDAYSDPLGHNLPDVFWRWLTKQDMAWEFLLGYPISEPYWVRARVAGVEQDVLVQLFERRVLTYTPANPAPWQVEMGNAGQHYLAWRQG